MSKRKNMTEQDKKDMFEMFDAGMKEREIKELTGRSTSVIYTYKALWRSTKVSGKAEAETDTKAEVKEGLESSDYAKAYLANDPAMVRSSFEIERNVRIKSRKTGILYEMDTASEERKIRITLTDGSTIEIELGMFEKFVDEGIDVFLEMKKAS